MIEPRVRIRVCDLEDIDQFIHKWEGDLALHIGAMSMVDISCGDGGTGLKLRKDLKYLYSLKGEEYLLPNEIRKKLKELITSGRV